MAAWVRQYVTERRAHREDDESRRKVESIDECLCGETSLSSMLRSRCRPARFGVVICRSHDMFCLRINLNGPWRGIDSYRTS